MSGKWKIVRSDQVKIGDPIYARGDVAFCEKRIAVWAEGVKGPGVNGQPIPHEDVGAPYVVIMDPERVVAPVGQRFEPAKPAKPTDAEVVAAWERGMARNERQRLRARETVVQIGAFASSFVGYQEARSRELRRLVKESAERRKLRTQVDCPLDHEAADVRDDAPCFGIGELATPFDKVWA